MPTGSVSRPPERRRPPERDTLALDYQSTNEQITP
jgi:hypothetical protein